MVWRKPAEEDLLLASFVKVSLFSWSLQLTKAKVSCWLLRHDIFFPLNTKLLASMKKIINKWLILDGCKWVKLPNDFHFKKHTVYAIYRML